MSAKHNTGNLQELGHSHYEIKEGQSDIRDWMVKDDEGKRLGWVKDLLFEEASRSVRYIVLNTQDNEYHLEARYILIPIGLAMLHETENEVIIPGISLEQITSLPDFDRKNFLPETEYMIKSIFSGNVTDENTETVLEDFYDHRYYDENNMYEKRTGGRNYPDIE